jgi:hypothetical protein
VIELLYNDRASVRVVVASYCPSILFFPSRKADAHNFHLFTVKITTASISARSSGAEIFLLHKKKHHAPLNQNRL